MSISPLFKRSIRLLVAIGVAGAVIWLAYFDSHSLIDRWRWHKEYAELTEQNKELRQDIEQLEEQLEQPPADSVIERIAREEYGMHLPGETIYRLPSSSDE